jgi:hypothetical protein
MNRLITFFALIFIFSAINVTANTVDSSFGVISNDAPLNYTMYYGVGEENKLVDNHKYYVSVSNVKYSSKAKSLQMVTRFFIDDLQEVLNARNTTPVSLGIKDEIEQHYPAIQRYLNSKLSIQVKDQEYKPQFLGAEYENDQIVLYIEFQTGSAPSDINMTFKAFFELFKDQKNLVHFKIKGQRKTLVFERDKPTDRVKF